MPRRPSETKKIMHDDTIKITSTTVRVPVFNCHSESVNIETKIKLTREAVIETLQKAPGIVVQDNPSALSYPLAVTANGKDDVFVGRIREDDTVDAGINMWIVADNLRKGAATNAVQIAQLLIKGQL